MPDAASNFGGAKMEKLPGVIPLIKRLRRIDAFVALKSNEFATSPRSEHLGKFGFPNAGISFENLLSQFGILAVEHASRK